MTLITRYFGGKEGLLLAIAAEFSKQKGNAELGYPAQNTLEEELLSYANSRFDEDVRQKDFIRVLIGRSAVDTKFRQKAQAIFSMTFLYHIILGEERKSCWKDLSTSRRPIR